MRFLTTVLLFCSFLPASALFATTASENPFRMIAILENERMLQAEPAFRLADYFLSKDDAVRARAVLAAGRIGNKAILNDLRREAADSSVEVRKMSAFALGQIRAREGLPTVTQLLKDADPEVRRLAVEAAGRIGGFETTALVLPFLDDPSPSLREQSALALALIKDKGTVDALVRKAGADDPAQWSYVYALYRLADERAVPVLHEVLAKPSESPSTGDPSSLLFSLKALWSMKKPLASGEIEELLQHSDPRVQQNALDTIAASADNTACPALRSHMQQLPPHSKWKALEAFGTLQCATVEEKMKYLSSKEPELRSAALKLIGDKELEKYLPIFDRASQDDSWIVRTQAAQSCGKLSADSAMPLLKRLIKDSDSAVRLAALESLGAFLPKSESLLLPYLQSADGPERSIAAEALGKTKDRKYLSALLEAYKANSDPDTRIAIIDALPDFADSQTLKVLEPGLKDPQYIVRSHTVEALKKLSGGSSYYMNGVVYNLDNFLCLDGKVSVVVQSQYPASFGLPMPERKAVISLEKGKVTLRLLSNEAPIHVANFVRLAEKGSYKGLRIHRVVPNFVIQGGDPRGDGWGGAEELLKDQFNLQPFLRGMVGMPTSGKDSGGVQFFVTMSRQPHLDGNYTVFGVVVDGMDAVDATGLGDRILDVQLVP